MVAALDRAFDVTVLAWSRAGDDVEAFRRALRGRVISLASSSVDARAADAVAAMAGRPIGYQRYAMPPRLLRQVLASRRFDVVHFDHPHSALALGVVREMQPHARTVLDAHNVEAEIVERLVGDAARWRRPLLRMQARRVRKLEERLANAMDLVLTCSDKDAAEFRRLGADRVAVVPNGIPPIEPGPEEGRTDLVFVGSLDWKPNADAALTLARDVWPLLRGKLAGARLVLVGRNPPSSIQDLAADDVLVTGGVESVAPYLARARATAVPLRAGSGTRIKILEAWAAGVPVIATRIAAEGLPYTDGKDLLLAESPEELACAIERVFNDAGLARSMRQAGLVTSEPFQPARIGELLERRYRELLASAPAERGNAARYALPYAAAMVGTS
jgi:glycosyltransferase involved in cell wall biosynthesis